MRICFFSIDLLFLVFFEYIDSNAFKKSRKRIQNLTSTSKTRFFKNSTSNENYPNMTVGHHKYKRIQNRVIHWNATLRIFK